MIPEMSGKRAKHRMRPPERVHRLRKPTMKPLQGFADGRGSFLRRITRAPWMAPLKFIQRLEFAQRLLLNGRRRVVVVQKRFQLPLFAPEGPGRLGILEPQAALLQHRTRFRHERRSAGGARHLGCNRDGPVKRLGPQRERQTMNRLCGWMQQQVSDVINSLFVFQDGCLSTEGQFPKPESLSNCPLRPGCCPF